MSVEPCPHGTIVGRCEFCRTDELAALRTQAAALQEQLAAANEWLRERGEAVKILEGKLAAAVEQKRVAEEQRDEWIRRHDELSRARRMDLDAVAQK